MTDSASTPRRRVMLYAILGGILAATIPLYCTAVVLIELHPTPTLVSSPSATPPAVPSRHIPTPAVATPSPQFATLTPTHTAFIPPTPTITPTPTDTPPPTRTRTPVPTETPPPTSTATEVPSATPSP